MTRGAAITIALLGTHLALAQPPRWNDTTFDPEVKRRFDWCERMRQVSAGAMSVRDVMRGVNLSVSLPDARTYSPVGFVNIDENGAIKEGKAAGFMVEILDEVFSSFFSPFIRRAPLSAAILLPVTHCIMLVFYSWKGWTSEGLA